MLSFTLSVLPIANENKHGMGDVPSPSIPILPGINFSRKYVEEADSSNTCAINARGEERACPPCPKEFNIEFREKKARSSAS